MNFFKNCFFLIPGAFANIFSLYIMSVHRKTQNTVDLVMAGICIVDLMLVIILPIQASMTLHFDFWPFGDKFAGLCKFVGVASYFSNYACAFYMALLSFYRYRIVSGSTISKITNGITSGISAVAITLIAVAIPMVSIALIVPYILFFTSKVPLNYDQKYLCYLIKGGPVVSSWCGMDAILSGESAEISWE